MVLSEEVSVTLLLVMVVVKQTGLLVGVDTSE